MTTANLRIVPRNFHDEATLTASEAAAGFAIANTQATARDTVWRSTSTGTVTISGSFSRDRVVNFFGMFRHVNHGGQIRVQLYSDAAWTTQVDDTGTVAINKVVGSSSDSAYAWGDDPYGDGQYDPLLTEAPYWFWFAVDRTIQSYKITLSSHAATYGYSAYWQASRLWLGKYFEPAINPSYGATSGVADNSDRNRSRGGSLRTSLGARWRAVRMSLDSVAETEVPTWMDILAHCQLGRDVVASLFPGDGTRRERDNLICGKFAALDVLGRQINRLTKNLALEEV